jgi:RNA polymerase sigma factor (sigma-70 family)
MLTDAELLQRYVGQQDERAFAELVQRHLGMVYATALRSTGGRRHLAEDISQKVFTDLARKAADLCQHPVLSGWLYRGARNSAKEVGRAELRRHKLNLTLAAMPIDIPLESPEDWEQLRPVIDGAMEGLRERDRELILMRFFQGLTFPEIATRLDVSENAARMRTERALDQLRGHLGRRGVTSTTSALGLLLANQAFASAPAGLASSVITTALAGAPVTSGIVATLLMSKITAPAVSAVLAAGITALFWTSSVPASLSSAELATLRAENVRLTQATAADAPAEAVAAVADEYATQVTAIAQGLSQRSTGMAEIAGGGPSVGPTAKSSVTPRGHRNHGTATAQEAALTFAWASDICDPDVFSQMVTFDGPAREKALGVLATMPETIRVQYPTPEAFYGLLLAASCLEAPPPGADMLEAFTIVELSPGRVAHRAPGSTRNDWEYQQTPDGWKYVLPEVAVTGLPGILNSRTLAKLAKR